VAPVITAAAMPFFFFYSPLFSIPQNRVQENLHIGILTYCRDKQGKRKWWWSIEICQFWLGDKMSIRAFVYINRTNGIAETASYTRRIFFLSVETIYTWCLSLFFVLLLTIHYENVCRSFFWNCKECPSAVFVESNAFLAVNGFYMSIYHLNQQILATATI